MQALLKRYRDLMISTKIISALASAWMVVTIGRELAFLISGVMATESPAWSVIYNELTWLILLAVAFLARLIAIGNIEKFRYAFVSISWLFSFAISWLYFKQMFPGGAMYSLFRTDLLASWCLIFVLLSLVRFTITASVALTTLSHEVDSYS